jgi:hypothetical protein
LDTATRNFVRGFHGKHQNGPGALVAVDGRIRGIIGDIDSVECEDGLTVQRAGDGSAVIAAGLGRGARLQQEELLSLAQPCRGTEKRLRADDITETVVLVSPKVSSMLMVALVFTWTST